MAKTKKKQMSKREKRKLRTQQIIFAIVSFIIIMSMILAYVAK